MLILLLHPVRPGIKVLPLHVHRDFVKYRAKLIYLVYVSFNLQCFNADKIRYKISAEVKEGPADCIRMDEVRAALKKMKRHKAPGLWGWGRR